MALTLNNRDGSKTVVGRRPRTGGGYETGPIGTISKGNNAIQNRVQGSVTPGTTIAEAKISQGLNPGKSIQSQTATQKTPTQQPTTQAVTGKPLTTSQVLAADPGVVASSRRGSEEYIGAGGERITPVASYETPASGFLPGIAYNESKAPKQIGYNPERTADNPLVKDTSGKIAYELREFTAERYAAAREQSPESFARAANVLAGDVSFALSDPFQRRAETDKTLGKDITIGYSTGGLLGAAYGEGANVLGRTLGPTAFKTAQTIGTGALVTGGVVTEYVAAKTGGPLGVGRTIPGLVAGAKGFTDTLAVAEPGTIITGTKPLEAAKIQIVREQPSKIISGIGERVIGLEVSEYGVPKTIPVKQSILVAGVEGPKGGVTFSVLGSAEVAGKNIPLSSVYEGRISGSLSAIETEKGGLFVSKAGKTELFAQTPEAKVLRSTVETASLTRAGELGATRGNVLFSQRVINPDEGALISFGTPREQTITEGVSALKEKNPGVRTQQILKQGDRLLQGGERKTVYPERQSLFSSKRASLLSPEEVVTAPTETVVGQVVLDLPAPEVGRFSLRQTPVIESIPSSLVFRKVGGKSIAKISSSPPAILMPVSSLATAPSVKQQPVQIPSTASSFKFSQRQSFIPKALQQQESISELAIPSFKPPTSAGGGGFVLPVLPQLGGGSGFSFKKLFRREKKQEQYLPSLTAAAFDITTKSKQRSGGFTGLEVRPIERSRLPKKYVKRSLL